jgi:hypothetical protein
MSDEVDAGTAPERTRTAAGAAEEGGAMTVVHLSRVPFADWSLLHVPVTARRRPARAGVPALRGPLGEPVPRPFDVTGTAGLFTIAYTCGRPPGHGTSERARRGGTP